MIFAESQLLPATQSGSELRTLSELLVLGVSTSGVRRLSWPHRRKFEYSFCSGTWRALHGQCLKLVYIRVTSNGHSSNTQINASRICAPTCGA